MKEENSNPYRYINKNKNKHKPTRQVVPIDK